jgi:hypothetical protein
MSRPLVLLLATLAWVVWVFATGLQKLARGEAGSVSVFPVIPMFPLAAWGLAYASHALSIPVGATVLGVIHGALLVALLVSIGKPWNFGVPARYEAGA